MVRWPWQRRGTSGRRGGSQVSFHKFMTKASALMVEKLEEQAKVDFESLDSFSVALTPELTVGEVSLSVLRKGQVFRLVLADEIPGSGHAVQRYLLNGTYQEVVDYLRRPGVVDELAKSAEELEDSVKDKMDEYPFG